MMVEGFNKQGVRLLPSKPKGKNIRVLSQYAQWEQDVLRANPYKCANCGTRETLTIHHKKPLSKIVAENTESHICNNKELFNVNNGELLCRTCHDGVKNMDKITLKKGTIIKFEGLPFELAKNTEVYGVYYKSEKITLTRGGCNSGTMSGEGE